MRFKASCIRSTIGELFRLSSGTRTESSDGCSDLDGARARKERLVDSRTDGSFAFGKALAFQPSNDDMP